MAQQKGHTEYFSTVLLIFTPRDAVPPKATELQAILQGITPVLETLQRYGCQGSVTVQALQTATLSNLYLNLTLIFQT